MNSINTQKLISTFLILSTAVSSSVLIFATSGNSIAENTPNDFAVGGNLPSNAFVQDNTVRIAGFATYDTLAIKENKRQDNLTDYFAEKLLGQMAEDNSSASLSKSASGISFSLPDMSRGMDFFLNDPTVSLVASIDRKNIKTKKGSAVEDFQKYFEEISPIVETASKDFNDKLVRYAENEMTAASFGSLDFVLSNAIAKLYNVKVPAEIADYHSALIKTFKTRSGLTGINNDPLRSYFYAKDFYGMVNVENKIILDATNNLDKKLSLLFPGEEKSLFAKYLGINTANAQWITTDLGALIQRIGTWIQNAYNNIVNGSQLAQTILQYVYKVATELLKDQLIHKLVQQTINWANNGFNGKPQYVENFGALIKDTVKSAGDRIVSDAMNKFNGGACPTLKPLLEITFRGPSTVVAGSTGEPYSCTIDQLGANLDEFKESFANGGWIAYRNILTNPQGTFMGSYLHMSDSIAMEQSRKEEEKKQEALAGNGNLDLKGCATEPIVYYLPDDVGSSAPVTMEDLEASFGKENIISAQCDSNGCSLAEICEADIVTKTPAQIASKATTDAISKSPIDRIVNANDVAGLVSALVNAAMTKLVGLGREGLAGLTTEKLSQTVDGSPEAVCEGYDDTGPKPTAKDTCIAQIGEATGGVDEQKAANLEKDLNDMQASYSEIVNFHAQIQINASQAKFYLEQASSSCAIVFGTSTDPDIIDAQFYVEQNYGNILSLIENASSSIEEITKPNGLLSMLSQLISGIKDKKWAGGLDEINTSLGLGIVPSGSTDAAKVKSFISKLSDQMQNPSSAFSRKFSTPIELVRLAGELQMALSKISGNACAVSEISSKINLNPNGCRLSTAKKDCTTPPTPQ